LKYRRRPILHSSDLFEFLNQKIDEGADLGRRARAAGKNRMHVDRFELVGESRGTSAPALISASHITVEAIVRPDEMASAILFLASDESRYPASKPDRRRLAR
jgi:hypothetical protein